jgi:hypothetical protein
MANLNVPYQEGHDFGIGVDSVTGDALQKGIVGEISTVEGASGGSGSFKLIKINNTSDLETHLGISADLSIGVGLFSASARFDYAKDSKVHSESINLLITCTKEFGFRQIDKPTLDAEAAELLANGNVGLFVERYGDYFVRGIKSGGQFFGTIRIETSSEKDRKEVEANLSASYGLFASGNVSTKFSEVLDKTKSQTTVQLYYEGGDVQIKPQTITDLITASNQWSDSVENKQKPYSVQIVPWTIANGPQPPNKADLEHQKDVLLLCAKLRSKCIDKLNVLDYILDIKHQSEYNLPLEKQKELQDSYACCQEEMDIIAKTASYAINHAADAMEPVTYAKTKLNISNFILAPFEIPAKVDGTIIEPPNPDFHHQIGRIQMERVLQTDISPLFKKIDNNQ